ncbi:hypothetical protein [Bathymodiolus japonicus methanotrophic gill symbiont]|uniref:hypothetical protein n=1 Tax=Bathymodiolus japonicus methanotrophic gill symbiont TaxID=113269 RepID=UPI001C8D0DDA|nr:hypothetical protein [Bathymodiolus japonicus methanotrophic gill symbiont]
MCSVCGGRRAAEASPVRCVGERITATGVPEFREVAWCACVFTLESEYSKKDNAQYTWGASSSLRRLYRF